MKRGSNSSFKFTIALYVAWHPGISALRAGPINLITKIGLCCAFLETVLSGALMGLRNRASYRANKSAWWYF
jgi:hypothetical protein